MFQLPVKQLPRWASDLDRLKSEFESFEPLTEDLVSGVAGWMLLEQVQNNLALDGIKLDRARLSGLVDGTIQPATNADLQAVNYGLAIRYLSDYVSGSSAEVITGKQAARPDSAPELTSDLLRSLHRLALSGESSAGQWRQEKAVPLYAAHDPASPDEVPRLLEIAFGWFSADSIRDLHPIEQAALVHLRLYELQPFDRASGRISRLASSLYTVRAGLPFIILEPTESPRYCQALLAGFQMSTTPLVELFAYACSRALQHMIEIVRGESA